MEGSKTNKEHRTFLQLQHWSAIKDLKLAEKLVLPLCQESSLFAYLYLKTKKMYHHFPQRKNGENPFLHPLNVVLNLRKAKISDPVTLCAGLIHDIIEETVDSYKKREKIKDQKKDIIKLDAYAEHIFKELHKELVIFCTNKKINLKKAEEIISTTRFLTRHKSDVYYTSINNIFKAPLNLAQKRAIQVKLADRIHNILCIEGFKEEERVFQCFKNLFILNRTKQYLMQKEIDENKNEVQLLFKKCGKATYDAFLTICNGAEERGMKNVKSMLQLAFKKYALEKARTFEVFPSNKNETHLMLLYQNIIYKYDLRLHHKWNRFEEVKKEEKIFCERFFKEFIFSQKQIQAIIDYKDAYALKEVMTYLMYLPNYTLKGFQAQESFGEKKIVMRKWYNSFSKSKAQSPQLISLLSWL